MTFNGEQLHAPRGTGVLYVKQGIPCGPFIFGSADQGGMRAGGLNMAGLAALACAAKEALDSRDLLVHRNSPSTRPIGKRNIKKLSSSHVCFKGQERLPHCTASFSQALQMNLSSFPSIAREFVQALAEEISNSSPCNSLLRALRKPLPTAPSLLAFHDIPLKVKLTARFRSLCNRPGCWLFIRAIETTIRRSTP